MKASVAFSPLDSRTMIDRSTYISLATFVVWYQLPCTVNVPKAETWERGELFKLPFTKHIITWSPLSLAHSIKHDACNWTKADETVAKITCGCETIHGIQSFGSSRTMKGQHKSPWQLPLYGITFHVWRMSPGRKHGESCLNYHSLNT